MDHPHRALPVLAAVTGLAWMAAVLLVAANPKGIDLAGDLAYDRAPRVHTLALDILMATAVLTHHTIRAREPTGRRAAQVLVGGAALMLVGNAVAFWGALVAGQQSEQFWGGLVGWLTYRWTIGLVGVFLSATTATWAISPAVTLVPAVLATFALLIMGTALAHTTQAHLPALRADGRSEPDAVPPIDKPITGPAGDGAGQGSNR